MTDEQHLEADLSKLIEDVKSLPITALEKYQGFMQMASIAITEGCAVIRNNHPEFAELTDQQLIETFVIARQPATDANEHINQAAKASKWLM